MIKDKVLEILYQLGFQPEPVDEHFGHKFEYEDLTFLLLPEDEDTHTVSMMVPGIFDISEENRVAVLEAMVKLSSQFKFVQPAILYDSVCLNYQHFFGKQEPAQEVIENMIRSLSFSAIQFHKFINGDDNE